jgi:hypothetical protein
VRERQLEQENAMLKEAIDGWRTVNREQMERIEDLELRLGTTERENES